MGSWTIGNIKQANRAAGWHFFDADALRFFRSKIDSRVYEGSGGIYFVTSEQYEGMDGTQRPRKFTVREFHPATGTVDTAGEFQEFGDLESARRRASRMAESMRVVRT